MRYSLIPVTVALLLAGCGGKTADNASAGNETAAIENIEEVPANEEPVDANLIEANMAEGGDSSATDAWAGKWTGPEGLALDIAKAATPGSYDVKITLLDGTESYTGTAAGDTIRFTRGGAQETIRKASGDETGLKYLAGKKNCLMIKQAEGFCRD